MPLRSVDYMPAARVSLLRWFSRNAKTLPWRGSKSAYEVWISEIMLQQTQVATVIPFYERFLAAFPSIEKLAASPLERVLELWSGLGYYRRARNLHEAAKAIVREHGGRFPAEFAQARSLPGIGDYTASAVLSIAFNKPYAVMDGNVARVMARLLGLRGRFSQPEFRRRIERELERLLSRRRPGDFNQAMMELGQTLCLPRTPQCAACPLRRWCRAFALGKPESYPLPRPRRKAEQRHLAAALIDCGDQLMLVRGLDDGLLGDLWNFPAAFGITESDSLAKLRQKLSAITENPTELKKARVAVQHTITYRAISVHLYQASVEQEVKTKRIRWLPKSDFEQAAVSQLARKIFRASAQL